MHRTQPAQPVPACAGMNAEAGGSPPAGVVIRPVTNSDLPDCARVGREFYREGGLPGDLVPEIFISNWERFIDIGAGYIEGAWKDGEFVGAIGGVVAPDVNDGVLVAHEMFWYVEKGHRGIGVRLLKSYLGAIKKLGVKRFTMVHLCGLMPEKLRGLYERMGMKRLEIRYEGEMA